MSELSIRNYFAEDLTTELRLHVDFSDNVYMRIESTKKPASVSRVFIFPFRNSSIPLAVINQRTGNYNTDIEVPYGYEGTLPQVAASTYLSTVFDLSKQLYDSENLEDDNNHNTWRIGKHLGPVIEKLRLGEYPPIKKD